MRTLSTLLILSSGLLVACSSTEPASTHVPERHTIGDSGIVRETHGEQAGKPYLTMHDVRDLVGPEPGFTEASLLDYLYSESNVIGLEDATVLAEKGLLGFRITPEEHEAVFACLNRLRD